MRRHAYKGLEYFAEELFLKREIGDSVEIPVELIEPFLEGQKGNPRDVVRRAFDGYVTRYLVERGMVRGQSRRPLDLAMGRLCAFRYVPGVAVIVTKKGELQDYLSRHVGGASPREIEESTILEEKHRPSLGDLELSEREIEEILAAHPEAIEEGLTLKGRQMSLHGCRFDLVFADSIGRTLLVELKRGIVRPSAVTQVGNYLKHLTDLEKGRVRPMLIGYAIPDIIKNSCVSFGIECREISDKKLRELLKADPRLMERIISARRTMQSPGAVTHVPLKSRGEVEQKLIDMGYAQTKAKIWEREGRIVHVVQSSVGWPLRVRVTWREEWRSDYAVIYDYSGNEGPLCIVPVSILFASPFAENKRKSGAYERSGYWWTQAFPRDHELVRLVLSFEGRWDILERT